MNINQVSFSGRLGSDPDIKYTESGKVFCKFSVAVRRRDGSDAPDWFTCKAWGKTAEIAAEYAGKGDTVEVEGNLIFEYWKSGDGETLSQHVVSVQNINFLARKLEQAL
jgi:single-strand DNA-binding protein